jgi:hypothetical protein
MKRRQEEEEEEDPSLVIDRLLHAQLPRTETKKAESLHAAVDLDDLDMLKRQLEEFKRARQTPMPDWLVQVRSKFYGELGGKDSMDLTPLLPMIPDHG